MASVLIERAGRLRNLAVIVDLCPWATRMEIRDDEGDPVVEVRSAGGVRKVYRLAESGPVLLLGRS